MQVSLLLALGSALALEPVTIKGNAFYNGTNDRFYIRGVDYQRGGSSNVTDPLADADACKRDVAHFKDLGLNTVRVYTTDNSLNHDECMEALEDAGIYLLLDVNSPKQSLNRANNETLKASYNSGYLQHVFATIDAFKDYPNTLGFFAANEVINDVNNTNAAPYIKAVVRDMKSYIKAQANRTIPVGYSAADISDNRWQQMTYLNCGDDEGERIDMFGMNDYSWCGSSSFTQSGWSTNVQNYKNYTIPMFLSEYGCIKPSPRKFDEVKSLYSTDMSPVYSGGLVYEYFDEENSYGLVKADGDSVTELDDYNTFKNALSNAKNPTGSAGSKSSGGAMDCPAYKENIWEVEPDVKVPDMPTYAQRYLKDGAGKPLGLDGPNTQSGSNLDKPDNDDDNSSSSSASSSSKTTSADSPSSTVTSSTSAVPTSSQTSATSTSSSSSSSSTSSKSKNAGGITSPAMGITALLLSLAAYI